MKVIVFTKFVHSLLLLVFIYRKSFSAASLTYLPASASCVFPAHVTIFHFLLTLWFCPILHHRGAGIVLKRHVSRSGIWNSECNCLGFT